MAEVNATGDEESAKYMFFSINLVRMFNIGGWNAKKIQRPSEITLLEFIININHSLGIVYGGSIAEGTDIEGSDRDSMMICPYIHVVIDANQAKHLNEHVFLMKEEGHRPCYPSLELLSRAEIEKSLISTLGGIDKLLQESRDGTLCLSSEKFAKALKEQQVTSKIRNLAEVYRHGPCTTLVVGKSSAYLMEYDLAFSVPCKSWPKEAEEWIHRPRPKGWPSHDVVQKVVKTGCTLVPVSNPYSTDQQVEWRISFLLGERELIWRLNNCQYDCLITLKYILKKHLDKHFPDKISTFHMKTILFWISEEQGLEYWREETIFHCIRDCLQRLVDCIKQKTLPHYFAKGNNIFIGKLASDDVLISEIQFVLSNIVEVVHNCFGFVCPLDECLLHRGIPLGFKIEEGEFRYPKAARSEYFQSFYPPFLLRAQLDSHFRRLNHKQTNSIQDAMANHPDGILDEHTTLASSSLKFRLGMILHRYSLTGLDNILNYEVVSKAEDFILKGYEMDAMAGMLQVATFYYMCRDMEKSKLWIRKAQTHEVAVIYIGGTSRRKGISKGKIEEMEVLVSDFLRTRIVIPANDVCYHPSDFACLPIPLQYECALFDDVNDDLCIHPVVFCEGLLVLIHMALGEVTKAGYALKHLAEAVKSTEGGKNRDIALNLLGYCYSLFRKDDEAVHSFYLSYQVRKSLKNHCLYHSLVIAMNRAYEDVDIC